MGNNKLDEKKNDLPSAVDDAADVMSRYKKRKKTLIQKIKNLSFRQLIIRDHLITKFHLLLTIKKGSKEPFFIKNTKQAN